MNLTNLYYFQIAAEEMNFTRAAKRLYISQQSLSGHIARLEEKCGTPLFERAPRLKLTYAGECVLEYAKRILLEERQMESHLSDIIDNRDGKLSLGVYLHRSQIFLSKTLPEFLRLYPHTSLTIETGLSTQLEERLLRGDLDLIVGFTPFTCENLEICHLRSERLRIVIPKDMFERKFINSKTISENFIKNGVDLKILGDLPFLTLEKDNRARALAERLFRENGLTQNILFQLADSQTMLALCNAGIGCGFIFEQGIEIFLQHNNFKSNLYQFPISDPAAGTDFVIAYHKDRYLNSMAKNFIRLSQAAYEKKETSMVKK